MTSMTAGLGDREKTERKVTPSAKYIFPLNVLLADEDEACKATLLVAISHSVYISLSESF